MQSAHAKQDQPPMSDFRVGAQCYFDGVGVLQVVTLGLTPA
jgi:hypothetical protein